MLIWNRYTSYGFEDRALTASSRFVVFFLQCTDDIGDTQQLLQRLLNLSSGFDEIPMTSMRRSAWTVEHIVKLKVYEVKLKEEYRAGNRLDDYLSLSTEEKLKTCIEFVVRETGRAVLLIIDELDRVKDTSGLASFIKSNSSADLKFLLVGVAYDYSALLADHTSLERTILPRQVDRMKDPELRTAIDLVEAYLRAHEIGIRFTRDAKAVLVESAAGFPWFVHAIGREALLAAYEGAVEVIDRESVLAAKDAFTRSSLARRFEDLYLLAVGNSPVRETMIRLFAKWGRGMDIPTSDIYVIAKRLEIRNPSVYTGQLTQGKYGAVLSPAPFAKRIYSFSNSMFHHYVRIRRSVYRGVREKVDTAWNEMRG